MVNLQEFLRRSWRTVGYWGLTANVVLLPVALVLIPWFAPEVSLVLVSGHFPVLLSAWVGAAAVRQWGKNKSPSE